MDTLEIVNEMLGSIGETPLNSLEESHPLISAGIQTIIRSRRRLQAREWWFNVRDTTLHPDAATQEVRVPNDATAVSLEHRDRGIAQRGRRMFDSIKNTFEIGRPIKVRLHQNLELNELPMHALLYIAADATYMFHRDHDGDPDKLRDLGNDRMMAWMDLKAEDTRQKKANLFENSRVAARLGLAGFGRSPF